MTDSNPSLPDFLGDDADEELVFEAFEAADAPAPKATMPAGDKAETDKPRRIARRGRKAVEAGAADPVVVEEPIETVSAEAAPAAEADEPADAETAPFPPQATATAGSKTPIWLMAIVACALLTCMFSLGGLIAVSRTLAKADVAREEAEAEREALRKVPTLVQHLDDASAKLDAAAAKLAAASPNGPPASISDVQHQLDTLKLALDARQPQGVSALNDLTRAGFSELGTRLDRIDAHMGGSRPRSPAPADDQ
jgi:hypothetical protein